MRHLLCNRALVVVLTSSLAWSPVLHAGDLNAEINNMFNSMNAVGNYTEPGAFRGQAMSTFTGGSLMMRVPNKRYQLYAFNLPSTRGSCNGIDINMGSFSLISGTEIKDMLQKMLSSLPGIAYQMAIKSISPLFGDEIQNFRNIADLYTSRSITSCELATQLMSSKEVRYANEAACREIAVLTGKAADATAAARLCAGSDRAAVLAEASASGDPSQAALVSFSGNLTWTALRRAQTGELDAADKRMIMSLLGTIIYDQNGNIQDQKPALITNAKQLLYGDQPAPNDPLNRVLLRMYQCSDSEVECLKVDQSDYLLDPFVERVKMRLRALVQAIRERRPVTPAEIGFVNSVSEPVYRMLAIATSTPDDSPALGLIERYGPVIAVDYAQNFIERYMRLGIGLLSVNDQLSPAQVKQARELQQNARNVLDQLALEKVALNQQVGNATGLADHLERLGRQLRSQNAAALLSMLGANVPYAP